MLELGSVNGSSRSRSRQDIKRSISFSQGSISEIVDLVFFVAVVERSDETKMMGPILRTRYLQPGVHRFIAEILPVGRKRYPRVS